MTDQNALHVDYQYSKTWARLATVSVVSLQIQYQSVYQTTHQNDSFGWTFILWRFHTETCCFWHIIQRALLWKSPVQGGSI